jgi:small-conductance mechanosensitive channel
VVVAYPYIPGSDSEAFKGISLLLGVLFSLGSTSLISNIIAGYTMTYRRAFKVGDRVKIGAHVGEIVNIRLMVTHMRSLKNEEVVLPNSAILAGEIVNYSAMAGERGLILHTEVGIGYEVPWRQVEAMLLMAADRTPGLLKQPEPFILQKALGDFAVIYELNAYCREADRMPLFYADLHRNIQDVFNEYDVQIMTPNYVADTEQAKLVARKDWYAPPAASPQEKGGTGGDDAGQKNA